jgi:hypothetical protein
MPRTTTESIFKALFAMVSTVAGTDWAGASIPLQYFSRNWAKVGETADGTMPALYQWDPRQEQDVRTGLGRSRRKLHALVDIRIQRNQPDQYPDTVQVINGVTVGPFSTILNNWADNLYSMFSPADGGPQTLTALQNGTVFTGALPYGAIADCYPTDIRVDRGDDASRVAVIQAVIEIITGG